MQLLRGRELKLPSLPGREETVPAEVSEVQTEVPTLAPAQAFQLKADSVVPIEISEYAGYAGLIAANGGLEPGAGSLFTKYCGCRVRLSVSEEESWSALNSGKLAGSVTTTDVLAVYGRQFKVKVPVQVGFSRGADGVLVTNDIRRVNALKGKVVAAAQFTETDFFIRYLAQEAGLPIATLGSLDATPSPDRLNLVYTEDGFAAGDLFLADLTSGKGRLAGAVTWEPKTSEVISQSGGKARLLTSNRNLLIIADILVLNQGFAEQHPKVVEGIVRALLEGNRLVRDNPEPQLAVIAQAFKWTPDKARTELQKVHLSNLPENLAFFSGSIDAAGSFGGIYQSAVYAYGSELIRDPADPSRFTDLTALQALEKAGYFKEQKIAIAPIQGGAAGSDRERPAPVQGHPLPLPAEFRGAGSGAERKPQEPGGHQAAADREPRVDGAAPGPRGQLARRGVPPAGRGGLRPADGPPGRGTVPRPRRGDPATPGSETRRGPEADRHRRSWLG